MAATLMSALLLLPTQSALASCAQHSGPDGAPVIFVGTADAERRGYTRFEVDEVRAGPDLAHEVWVLSGQEQPPWPLSVFSNAHSSVDADFALGDRYVVGANRSFATNACQVSSVDAGASRSGAREPIEDGVGGADKPIGPLGQTLWVGGIVGLLAATVRILQRLRRRGNDVSAPSI
ncbi:MAG: hypothetical protein ABI776_14830 [Nocardioidaceae bacterium]